MIIQLKDLKTIRANNPHKKIVIALGSFDLFHWEHLEYLNDAKKQGDILVVVVKDDYAVSFKGIGRPVISQNQRCEIVDNIKAVDYTILATKSILPKEIDKMLESVGNKHVVLWWELFYPVFDGLKPDILYYEINDMLQPCREKIAKMYDIQLLSRPRTERISTTKIIDKIKGNL